MRRGGGGGRRLFAGRPREGMGCGSATGIAGAWAAQTPDKAAWVPTDALLTAGGSRQPEKNSDDGDQMR